MPNESEIDLRELRRNIAKSSAPTSYAAAVALVGREAGFNMSKKHDGKNGLPAAMFYALQLFPELHDAWRVAGFPAVA